ncbi:MAG: hypothetical protein K6A91_04195 [Clostridia bacterium]|nr:hypothetical protein [Clostridia bacterium]
MKKRINALLCILFAALLIVGVAALCPQDAYAADYDHPAPSNILIDVDNNGGAFSSDKLYYNSYSHTYTNGNDGSGYQAWYDPDSGTLYLWNYDGGQIRVNNSAQKELTIYVIGDNTITTKKQHAIFADGLRLTIKSYSASSGEYDEFDPPTLTIKQVNEGTSADGSGICNSWASGVSEDMIFTGAVNVHVDSYCARSCSGLYTKGKLYIEGDAVVDINAKYGHIDAYHHSEAVYAYNGVYIETTGTVNFSAAARDNWEGKWPGYAVYIENGSFTLQPGAYYVSLSSVGENISLCNKTLPDMDFYTTEYHDTAERTDTYARRFYRSDYYSPEVIPLNGYFFPDPDFRDYVKRNYYYEYPGWVMVEDLMNESAIKVTAGEDDPYSDPASAAYSIKGIENFMWLSNLVWNEGHLKAVDLSNNKNLIYLDLSSNVLTALDVSENIWLVDLYCQHNDISELDLANNIDLEELNCSGNAIRALDLSNQKCLIELYCGNNLLKWLDLKKNTRLSVIKCGNDLYYDTWLSDPPEYKNFNEIPSLDVSRCADLMMLECQRNEMKELKIGSQPNLDHLYCYGNLLTQMDISGLPMIMDAYYNGTFEAGQYFDEYRKDFTVFRLDGTESMLIYTFDDIVPSYSATVTMNENFNLNLYVKDVPEEFASGYTVKWTFDGFIYTKNLGELDPQTGGQYPGSFKVMLANVYSYQMTKPFDIKVYKQGTSDPVKTIEYSVQTYFVNQYNKTSDALFKKIYAAALDYGASAQLYFDGQTNPSTGQPYDTDAGNLANKTTNPSNTITATKPTNKASKSGSITGMEDKMTASLIFGSETSIKIYFTYSKSISDLSITADNGKTVTKPVAEGGNQYSVKIEGIRSFELYKDYTFTFKAGTETRTVTYSAYAYAASKWDNSNANLSRLVKALVAYGELARQKWQ